MELKKIKELLIVFTTLSGNDNLSELEINTLLDNANKQINKLKAKEKQFHRIAFFRVLLSIGDISRQHNYLKDNGIISNNGGFGQARTFRVILRWLENNHSKFFYNNLLIWVEHSSISTLLYNSIKTNRDTGDLLSSEHMDFNPKKIAKFLVKYYKDGNLALVAKHLPRHITNFERTTKLKVKRAGKITLPEKKWYKLNDVEVKLKAPYELEVTKGDVVKYPREMGPHAKEKRKKDNILIAHFCKEMDWQINDETGRYPKYDEFRKNQNTIEQKMSSKSILKLDVTELYTVFNQLPTQARRRLEKSLCYKDANGDYQPKPKWEEVSKIFIRWMTEQETIAKEVREEEEPLTRSTKVKNLKLKTVGISTSSLMMEILGNIHLFNNESKAFSRIDAEYTAMLQNMSFLVPCAVWLDISGSMGSRVKVKDNYVMRYQIATALAVTFSTNDPSDYKNQVGIFARKSTMVSSNNYVKKAITKNPYLYSPDNFNESTGHAEPLLSEKDSFSSNFLRLSRFVQKKMSSGDWITSTNPVTAINYHLENANTIEELPKVLLMISDGEFNNGRNSKHSLKLALEKANKEGWFPLVILWDIVGSDKGFDMENVLHLSGTNESVLTQIIKNMKIGSIDPYKAIEAINADDRYKLLN